LARSRCGHIHFVEAWTLKQESESEEAVKQYGHAVGHAVEHLSQSTLGHGESIAIDMCVSSELAVLANMTNESTLEEHFRIFEALRLPTRVPDTEHPDRI
jgi:3-dehydroquinate synthase